MAWSRILYSPLQIYLRRFRVSRSRVLLLPCPHNLILLAMGFVVLYQTSCYSGTTSKNIQVFLTGKAIIRAFHLSPLTSTMTLHFFWSVHHLFYGVEIVESSLQQQVCIGSWLLLGIWRESLARFCLPCGHLLMQHMRYFLDTSFFVNGHLKILVSYSNSSVLGLCFIQKVTSWSDHLKKS